MKAGTADSRGRHLLRIVFVLTALFAAGLVASGVVAGAGPLAVLSDSTSTEPTTESATTSTDSTTTDEETTSEETTYRVVDHGVHDHGHRALDHGEHAASEEFLYRRERQGRLCAGRACHPHRHELAAGRDRQHRRERRCWPDVAPKRHRHRGRQRRDRRPVQSAGLVRRDVSRRRDRFGHRARHDHVHGRNEDAARSTADPRRHTRRRTAAGRPHGYCDDQPKHGGTNLFAQNTGSFTPGARDRQRTELQRVRSTSSGIRRRTTRSVSPY